MRVHIILKAKGNDVATIAPDASVAEAVAALADWGIGALLVTSGDGVPAGILSERDVVRALALEGKGRLDRKVRDLMTAELKTCGPDDEIGAIMATMTKHRIRHLPVLEDGKLAGVVSIGDVVKYRLQEIEFEANSMRQMIAGS